MTVNRTTSQVTAALANSGTVGASFAVYPDAYLPFGATPVTVLPGSQGSYTWDATATTGKYAFSVYGPDGFVTSFAGTVGRRPDHRPGPGGRRHPAVRPG